MRLNSKGKLITLLANIRLGLRRLNMSNTLAYYKAELITTVNSFILLAQGKYPIFFCIKKTFVVKLGIIMAR